MTALYLTPVVISCFLMSAHFLRIGMTLPATLLLAAPLLLFVRRPWVRWFFTILLLVCGVLWILIAWSLAGARVGQGLPSLRLLIILGTVVALNFLGSWLMNRPVIRERYRSS